ncbi:ribonuclease P protein component [Geomicrobium sp. JCM 19037]|uniref:ribonuclease P protein component n=1 Tax=unclassified Geomicrobium TaxID=2628951 RepID=UPI00045F446C|nr:MULTISPECIES: ribonuclease P protein component [unclassified Geomicrobium]GAK04817.1 ribonuclease P protein component [Geomicrobium sp. JCM 19037]GAK11987.1 ribonuclease P protein component [Geomicrobium sp. JCM 19039]
MKKAYRIKDQEEFAAIFKHGKTAANRQFVIYVLDKPDQQHFRVGFTVGRKVGNAVTRNYLKRWMRELMRAHADQIEQDKDYVLIARKALLSMDYEAAGKSLKHVLKRAEVWRKC